MFEIRSKLIIFMSFVFSILLFSCEMNNINEAKSLFLNEVQVGESTDSSMNLSNWMKSVDDSSLLSELSIPGSHDSGALYDPNGWIFTRDTAKCQNLTIKEQLNFGVRFLDVRCRHYKDSFTIHHGMVYQHINFDDVIHDCVTFLNQNPSETIIMSVKEEYNAEGNSRSFEDTFTSYYSKNPDRWYLGSNIPSLNKVRGKIVLFRRFPVSNSNLPMGIDTHEWKDNTTFISTNKYLRVQDNYNPGSSDNKWGQIISLFNEALVGSSSTLYVNFSSGYMKFLGLPKITKISNEINPKIVDYFKSKEKNRYGVVVMDYVDAEKSSLIIQTNFVMPGN